MKGAGAAKPNYGRGVALPDFIAPCLATPVERPPSGEAWAHEIKFDGYRILARIEDGDVRLLTRNGHTWTDRFEGIAKELARINVRAAMLDAEIVVRQADGSSDFAALAAELGARRSDRMELMAFDMLHLDGRDLRPEPLVVRKRMLATLLAAQPKLGRIHRVDALAAGGGDVLEAACALGLEGIVSKRLDRPYRSGRQRSWLKAKCRTSDEFVVVGFLPMNGAPHLVGALVLASRERGGLAYAGRVGTGFTAAAAADLQRRLVLLRMTRPPVKALPPDADLRGIVWTRPEVVVRVRFRERLPNGALRHAVFKELRESE